jgi:hypothetical protein
MNAAPDNEAGFWESTEIVEIHDEILRSAGSAWDDVAEFPSAWFASDVAQAFKQRLISALEHEFADAPLFILKDPRLCKLVPLWLSLLADLDITPLFVIPIRNPLEVAASLKKRNSFLEDRSLLLWLQYFLAAEWHTRGYRRSFVTYDGLFRDWRRVADTIGHDLDVSWPRQSYAADIEIEKFISTELRHHDLANDEVYARKNVILWVKTAFAWALRAAEHLPTASDDLDRLRDDLSAAERAFMPLLVDREMSILTLTDDVRRLTEDNALEVDERQRLEGEHRDLESRLADRDTAIDDLRNELERERTDAADGRRLIADLTQQLDLRDEQSLRMGAEAETQVQHLQAVIADAHGDNAALRRQHDLLVNSTLWRLSAPFRSIVGALSPRVRLHMRRILKAMYWVATPHRIRQRLAFFRARRAGQREAALPPAAVSNPGNHARSCASPGRGPCFGETSK